MIQEREFVKMRNFIPKNIRKLKELSRHPLAPKVGGPARSTSSTRKVQRARPLSFEHSGLPRSSGPVGMLA